MALFKRVSSAVVWTIVIGASLLSITQAAASAFGLTSGLIVVSGSMEPAISTGSYVVARPVAASTVEVGDIVSVRSQDGRSIIHRVVSVDDGPEDTMLLRLRGDANNATDDEVYVASSVLSPVTTIPGLGYAMAHVVDAKHLMAANPALPLGAAMGAGLLIWAVRSGRSSRADGPGETSQVRGRHMMPVSGSSFRFAPFSARTTPPARRAEQDDTSLTGAVR